jgi:hypothetical protein
MAKPSSSATLDTGHALYANLHACWPLLEGSGTTSADKKGSRTLTLSGSGLWSTDGDGPVILTTNNSDTFPLSLATSWDNTVNGHKFSLAWRAKQTTSNDAGMLAGNPNNTHDYLWLRGGTGMLLRINDGAVGTFSPTDFTALDDWVLTGELEPAVTYHYHLYKNGAEVASSPIDNGGVGLGWTIAALGNGFSGAGTSFVGTISYVYLWDDRVLTQSEASTLHSDPYALFASAGSVPAPYQPWYALAPMLAQ